MIVLLGDSHSRAIINGYAALQDTERDYIQSREPFISGMLGPAFAFSEPFWVRCEAGVKFTAEMQTRFSAIVGESDDVIKRDDDRKFIFSIGAQPSLLHLPGAWNAHTAGKHRVGLGYLSQAAFRATLLHFNRFVFGFFRALQDMNVHFSVMAEPPMSPQFAFIQQKGERGLDLWRRHAETFRAELARLDIPMEMPPSVVYEGNDDNGFLRLPLCDSSVESSPHGNSVYGEIFLRSILRKRGMDKLELDVESIASELDKESTLVHWHTKLGFSLANARKPAAVKHFRAALEIDPSYDKAMFGLAYAHERIGEIDAAERQFAATLTTHPTYADCWAALAALQVSKQNYPDAYTSISNAIRLNEKRPDWKLRLGSILERLGKLREARDILYAQLASDISDDRNGLPSTESPSPSGLIPEPDPYAAAIKQARSIPPYLIILGRIELDMKNIDDAERYFNRAVALDNSKPSWQSYIADVHFSRGNWSDASTCYAIALKHSPQVLKYAKRLAYCQEQLGKIDDAQKTYIEALSHRPDDRSLIDLLDKVARGKRKQ